MDHSSTSISFNFMLISLLTSEKTGPKKGSLGGYPKMLELKVRENIGDPTFDPTSRTSKSTIATLQEIETYRNFKLQNPTQIGNLLVDLFRESNFTLKTPSASARFSNSVTLLGGMPPTQTLRSGAKLRRPFFPEPLPIMDIIMALNMGCQTWLKTATPPFVKRGVEMDGIGSLPPFLLIGNGWKKNGDRLKIIVSLI